MGFRDFFSFGKKPAPVQETPAPQVEAKKPAAPMLSRVQRMAMTMERAKKFGIVAAKTSGGSSTWNGTSDDFNKEYLDAIIPVVQKSQDLDVNNPDVRGWNRQRTSQCIGKMVNWKCAFRGDEVGVDPQEAHDKGLRINRYRQIHSRVGGFDASGRKRTEAKMQETSFLTMLVQGCCLVHRVGKKRPMGLVSMALEIIPGIRIETPRDRLGDPLISFGIQYTDDRRTEIEGFHVRKPNRSIGAGNMIWDFQYDFVPVEDAALMALTEIAGLDRSLPATVALVRTLRNKGEFAESAVASARAQAKRFAAIKVESGANAWDRADDDNQQELPDSSTAETNPVGTVTMGDVELLYLNSGEDYIEHAATLPGPDFPGFMGYMDERCARGLNTSKSRFTRTVDSSYSAGRQEEQHDEPAVDQLRECFAIAWQRVHEWFMDAVYLAGLEDFPNYASTRAYWTEARITPPGKEHINPVDTMTARRMGYALRTLTPQQACEADGKDFESNVREWGEAIKLIRQIEKDMGLEEGVLDVLLDIPAKQHVDESAASGEGIGGEDKTNKSEFSLADTTFKPINRIAAKRGISRNGVAHV